MAATTTQLIETVLNSRKAASKAGRIAQEKDAVTLMERAAKAKNTELGLRLTEKWGHAPYEVAKAANWSEMLRPDIASYDVILINTSAGKDSQTTMRVVCDLAKKAGIMSRVHAVHADLGRMDWSGTRELAQKQADVYGIPLHVIARPQGDLPTHIKVRGKFPSSACRYCTSDHKRGQVAKVITQLARETGITERKVRVLSCMGIRAEESSRRATFAPFCLDSLNSNQTKREVHKWFPIFEMSTQDVWDDIKASGVSHHWAYDIGMPRLSCNFCFFVGTDALIVAGHHNRATLVDLVKIEEEIGHTFKHNFRLANILEAVDRGVKPTLDPQMAWVD